LSVIGQNYPNLEYIVIDGESSDNSVEIIKRHAAKIAFWESTPDNGLYHALQKGFEKSTGEIMGWINSDDILLPGSLFSIAEIFTLSEEIEWIQGHPVVIDDKDRFVYQRPPVYEVEHFLSKKYHDGRFIQQESTFWKRSLWGKAGGYISREYSYAGDFELWMRFLQSAPMFLSSAMLGAFRTRSAGQISKSNFLDYLTECDDIIDNSQVTTNPTHISGKRRVGYHFGKNEFYLE